MKELILYRGRDGKIDKNGNRLSAHGWIENSLWTSYSYNIAKKYGRRNGVDMYSIQTNSIEYIKVPGNTFVSKARDIETTFIKNSNADVVELDTIDGNGREIQVVVKNIDKLKFIKHIE